MHVCTNETIGGIEYHWAPDVGAVPLVADMSSHILSRPIDVSKYGVIYGGAQKERRLGKSDAVIVRKDLLDRTRDHAVGIPLEGAGGERFDAEHAADVRHLHRRDGVRMAARAGRLDAIERKTSRRRSCCTTRSMRASSTTTRYARKIARV